jgi:hypothetical protein
VYAKTVHNFWRNLSCAHGNFKQQKMSCYVPSSSWIRRRRTNLRLEEKINRKTRKILPVYRMHHPKADLSVLYVIKERGRKRLVTY